MSKPLYALLLFLVWGAVAAAAADLKEDFWEAARKGNAAKVKALVEQGVDMNAKTPQGTTALGLAADNGHLEVVAAHGRCEWQGSAGFYTLAPSDLQQAHSGSRTFVGSRCRAACECLGNGGFGRASGSRPNYSEQP
jgi:hypothetical protein